MLPPQAESRCPIVTVWRRRHTLDMSDDSAKTKQTNATLLRLDNRRSFIKRDRKIGGLMRDFQESPELLGIFGLPGLKLLLHL